MPRVIALSSTTGSLARMLTAYGYQVVDMHEASRRAGQVDAYLYTGYHPDITTPYSSSIDPADISLGSAAAVRTHDTALMLNITGQRPEAVLALLERHLQHRRL